MEDDGQGINGNFGEDHQGNQGEEQQGSHYEDKDQQGIHNEKDNKDERQHSQLNCHHVQHLLPSPPHSHADSAVPIMVDGTSGAVKLLGEYLNSIAVCRGDELVSTTTLFPCSLHLNFFCRLE